MPIISEKREGSRSVPRRWLAGCGVLVALLLLLPLVPFVMPVALHVGDRWLCVYISWHADYPPLLSAGGDDFSGVPTPGQIRVAIPGEIFEPYHPRRREHQLVPTDFHQRWVKIARWHYVVLWLRGHRGEH